MTNPIKRSRTTVQRPIRKIFRVEKEVFAKLMLGSNFDEHPNTRLRELLGLPPRKRKKKASTHIASDDETFAKLMEHAKYGETPSMMLRVLLEMPPGKDKRRK